MIVCVCHRVNDQTIARAARSGMAFDDIQLEYGVATQCGQCECAARALHAECSATQQLAHIHQTVFPIRPVATSPARQEPVGA